MNLSIFFFITLEATQYPRYQSYRQHKGDKYGIQLSRICEIPSISNVKIPSILMEKLGFPSNTRYFESEILKY